MNWAIEMNYLIVFCISPLFQIGQNKNQNIAIMVSDYEKRWRWLYYHSKPTHAQSKENTMQIICKKIKTKNKFNWPSLCCVF